MRMYYVANARMPTEKAHGIQIAKMCEALIEAGADLTLIVPRRTTEAKSLREYYGLRVEVPLVRLPAIDWYTGGRAGYFVSSVSFMFSYTLFILWKKISGETFVLYTVDTDNYSSSALAFFREPLFSEMHGGKPITLPQRLLFRYATGIIAINSLITRELQHNFPSSPARYLVEPNGVDLSMFSAIDKREARKQLGLPFDAPIALYAGRFFAWKGLEILPQAAALTPSVRWQLVGGIEEDFKKLTNEALPPNMFFAGSRPHSEMPLWLAAADTLVVLGTVRDTQSYRYTSPMKLFEYLAAGRPTIASRTPAICEIVSEKEVFFYEPDNAEDLAHSVTYAITSSAETASKLDVARRHAATFSWHARGKRILDFIRQQRHD